MCLGIPGRIVATYHDGAAPMARVDFAGQERSVCLAYLPDLGVGDYVVAHLGYALTRIDEATAAETLELMRDYGVLADPGEPGSAA